MAAIPQHLTPGVPQKLDAFVTRLVAPNPGPLTGPGTNTYLLHDAHEVAVIDPGPDDPAHIAAIVAAGGGQIRWILCTHTHSDHSPGASSLKKETGASLLGMTAPATQDDFDPGFDRVLKNDDVITVGGLSVKTVFTPGHASNHLCYLLENTGMLFTGDHIMQGSTVVISAPDGNMRQYLNSLRHLHQLDMKVLAPGHGYLIENPHEEVDRLVRHRLGREQKLRNVLRRGPDEGLTLDALLAGVYDDVPTSLHRMALRSLRAHLEKLVEEQEVELLGDRFHLRS